MKGLVWKKGQIREAAVIGVIFVNTKKCPIDVLLENVHVVTETCLQIKLRKFVTHKINTLITVTEIAGQKSRQA